MNIQQKKLVANIVTVVLFTTVMIVGFANIKNIINRSESMRAMDLVGKEILEYRKQYGALPNETYVNQFIEKTGIVRLGELQYRAQWIEFGAKSNETILAYTEKNFGGFVKSGYIVLWLDGRIEWINEKHFEKIISEQQQKQELQWLHEHLNNQNQF